MKIKNEIFIFIVYVILITIFLSIVFYPVVKMFSTCEERGWDGSEYHTGVKSIGFIGKETIVKCNKDNDTDVMIDVIDAIPGVKIR